MRVFRVAEISSEDLTMWVEMANSATDAMIAECAQTGQSLSEYIGQRFAEMDIVYGVWPDKGEPDGVGVAILKGAGMFQLRAQHRNDGKKVKVSLYCLRISSKREAWAMAETFGDHRADQPNAKPAPGMPSTGGHVLSMGTRRKA